MNKNKKLAFTLAEVLIVIGIIGVVAALTLPNLNHATGDKETVTRLQKAYSILNEANDRAVAIYGPISTWKSNEQCANDLGKCWMERIREFLKVSKDCNEYGSDNIEPVSCEFLRKGDLDSQGIVYLLNDGISIGSPTGCNTCNCGQFSNTYRTDDWCIENINIDINGPNKGKNIASIDIFAFHVSDSVGITYLKPKENVFDSYIQNCSGYYSSDPSECTWWVMEYGNLDYLKADEEGKCNDSNIILDGVTNTSCH